jgi:hypothetical protein
MNYDIGNQKWNESLSYRLFVSSMAHVRWLVYRRRHHSPKGALDVKLLMDRLRRFCQADTEVEYVTEHISVSEFVGLSVQDLRYLADVGEWVDLDRQTREMDDAEYEKFWQNERDTHRKVGCSTCTSERLTERDWDEVFLLNQLFYQQDSF